MLPEKKELFFQFAEVFKTNFHVSVLTEILMGIINLLKGWKSTLLTWMPVVSFRMTVYL